MLTAPTLSGGTGGLVGVRVGPGSTSDLMRRWTLVETGMICCVFAYEVCTTLLTFMNVLSETVTRAPTVTNKMADTRSSTI